MNQKLDLQIRGLYTSPNNLSGVPPGALEEALNLVVNFKNLAESRRGQTQYGDPLTIGGDQINKLFNYSSSLIVNYADKMAYDSGSGVWVDYDGTYFPPTDETKIRSLEALRNFYFTSSKGIYKISALTTNPRTAGVVRALGGTGSLSGAAGFLQTDTAVAYRMLWGYTDANNNLILGAPSQREIVSNDTGGSRDVSLTYLIPDTITTEYFYQIYRSNATISSDAEPSDELQLVIQGNPTEAEITAKEFTVVDSTPYSLMRATLYTSPSQEGIANANIQPPYAVDMDVFKNCAFYANIKQKQTLSIAMISVVNPSLGYAECLGDTTNASPIITDLQKTASIVIQDLTYTADAAGPSGNDINITYTGGGTAGSEIVTVDGTDISVQIQSGVSTATQVKTAIDASIPASALISVAISGGGANAQVTVAQTFLAGGFDTTLLRKGMRVIGTGIQADSIILSIDSASQITISKNATALGNNVSLEIQDRFTIGGVDYWAGSTQDIPTSTFEVISDGTPGTNINDTAINLVSLINQSPLNTTLYAYYISALDDLPGQILFEERSIGGTNFIATSTAGSSFVPNLPNENLITNISVANPTVITSANHGLTTGDSITIYDTNSTPSVNGERTVTVTGINTFTIGVAVTVSGNTGYWIKTSELIESDNEERQNRVMISKVSQVEAVPVYRYFDIGSANFPIQRVVALRDGIFFFKKDGIYRLSGETFESFVVTLLDNTVVLTVPESAVAFNNQVFCFTNQGVCAVADGGVKIVSVPIENVLLELASEQYTYFSSASFGVAYESARLYMFFTVTEEDDQFATQAFIYNSLTDSWTRWVMNRTCGIVNTAVNKLFMGQTDTGQILIERKNYTNADFADEQYDVMITDVISNTEIELSSVTDVVVGMTLIQNSRNAFIEEINGNILTITPTNGLVVGSAIVYVPIMNRLSWLPVDCDNPGILKQYPEVTFFFKNAAFREIDAGFATNISTGEQVVNIENIGTAGWGQFPWGNVPWGGALGGQTVLRTYIPKEKQRGSWLFMSLETNEAFTGFSCQGASVLFNLMSSRIK